MDVRGIRSPDCALNVSHVLSRLAEHGSIATALSEGGTEIRTSPPAVYSESLMQRRGITTVSFYRPTCSPALDVALYYVERMKEN